MFHFGQIERFEEWYPPSRKPYVGINDPRIYAESQTPSTSLARDPISSQYSYYLDKERSFLIFATARESPTLVRFGPAAWPFSGPHPVEPILPPLADRRNQFLFPTPINIPSKYQNGRQVSFARRVRLGRLVRHMLLG